MQETESHQFLIYFISRMGPMSYPIRLETPIVRRWTENDPLMLRRMRCVSFGA
jgi:hypothetical protein